MQFQFQMFNCDDVTTLIYERKIINAKCKFYIIQFAHNFKQCAVMRKIYVSNTRFHN